MIRSNASYNGGAEERMQFVPKKASSMREKPGSRLLLSFSSRTIELLDAVLYHSLRNISKLDFLDFNFYCIFGQGGKIIFII